MVKSKLVPNGISKLKQFVLGFLVKRHPRPGRHFFLFPTRANLTTIRRQFDDKRVSGQCPSIGLPQPNSHFRILESLAVSG